MGHPGQGARHRLADGALAIGHHAPNWHRQLRAHLVQCEPLVGESLALFAELDARGETEGIDKQTAEELLLRLRERELRAELQHSGRASCGFEGSAGYGELIAGPRLNDGHWHTVRCIKAPTAIQLVVDGKMFTQPANVGSIANAAPVVIGARPGGDWYAGDLDEISIQIG